MGTATYIPKSYLLDLAALSILTTSHPGLGNIQIICRLLLLLFFFQVHDITQNRKCSWCSRCGQKHKMSMFIWLSRPKVEKWVPPNFHNISSVETGKTISSIHCRMKEYISKICLWNTMIKQETDQLFSQTTLNSNQIKKRISWRNFS